MNKILKHLKKMLNMLEKNMTNYSLELFILLLFIFIFLLRQHTLEYFQSNDNLEAEIVNGKCGH